jgi:outer membrane protein assembly factor BamB
MLNSKILSRSFVVALIVSLVSCGTLKKTFLPTDQNPSTGYFHAIWIKNHDPVYDTGNFPITMGSPLIKEGLVFSGSATGHMIAYDQISGRTVWKMHDGGNFHTAPVFFNDHIYYGNTEGRFFVRHYLTGKLKYSVDLGEGVETDAVIAKGRIFLQTRDHKLQALDLATGKILWSYKRSVPYTTTLQRASRPAYYKNRVFVGFADGYVVAFNIEDGLALWEKKLVDGNKFIDVDMGPLVVQGKLVVGSLSGHLMSLNPSTGRSLKSIPLKTSRTPMVLKNGYMIVGSVDGEVALLDSSLKIVQKLKLSEGAISSFAEWKKGYVVTSVNGELFHINTGLSEINVKRHLGNYASAVFGQVAVSGETLAVLSARNRLYVYGNPTRQ